MKLSERLEVEGLDQGEQHTVVAIVQQWLLDQARRMDRTGLRGETIRELITDLHIEMIKEEGP